MCGRADFDQQLELFDDEDDGKRQEAAAFIMEPHVP